MNTHRGQTLAVVFNPLKHLYELTYTRHKGLIVCLRGFILVVFLLVLFFCVAIACNIFIFPFLYIQALAVVFPNYIFLHCGEYKLLCVSDDVTNHGCWPP